MARVMEKVQEVRYAMDLSKREAEALTELLIMVNDETGEGPVLSGIYGALCAAGCESNDTFHKKGTDGEIIVYREDA